MRVAGVIPARMASTRFPNKPLVKILGIPMIEHVARRTLLAKKIDDVYLATCDQEIADASKKMGIKSIMTSDRHTRGTDRVAEAAKSIDADLIINIQGDEPLIDPDDLDAAISSLEANVDAQCSNLITPILDEASFRNKNVVKATIDLSGKVLYFSRSAIPHALNGVPVAAYRQIGVYLFRSDFLQRFTQWPESPLEKIESVDMMRILENGYAIYSHVSKNMIGVDVPSDVALVEEALLKDSIHSKIASQISMA